MNLEVRVQTRASQNKVVTLSAAKFKVYVTVAPEDGRANQVVLELLSDHFGLSRSCFRIIKGEKTRDKIISIEEE